MQSYTANVIRGDFLCIADEKLMTEYTAYHRSIVFIQYLFSDNLSTLHYKEMFQKVFVSKNLLAQKKICVKIFFWVNKNLVSKKFLSQKNVLVKK